MSTTLERNAAHTATVRTWLDEALSFGALECAVTDLEAIREACDSAGIEFSDFAALDEVILAYGDVEQAAQAKRSRVNPEEGMDMPLDGEQGSVVNTEGLDDLAAAALCRARR